MPRQNNYYTRLPDCTECPAKRGYQCLAEDGSLRRDVHMSRAMKSEAHSSRTIDQMLVDCPVCGVAEGRACRSMTYGTRMSKAHKARRDLIAELDREPS